MVDLFKSFFGSEKENKKLIQAEKLLTDYKYNESLALLFELEKETHDKKTLSKIHALMARNYDFLLNYSSAIIYASKAVDEDKSNPLAQFQQGMTYYREEKYDLALPFFRFAVDADSRNLDFLFKYAFSLDKLGRLDEALDFYKRYESLEPKHVGVLHNLGLIYCKKGQHDLEHEYYKKALSIDKGYDYPYVSGAICFSNRKMYKEALEVAERGVQNAPHSLKIYVERGYAHFDLGNKEKAKQDAEYVLGKDPNNAYARKLLDKMNGNPLVQSTKTTNPELTSFAPVTSEVKFDRVAGMEDFKNWVKTNIISPLKNPELAKKYKKRFGGGVIFYGPPGCGKTYLAGALAGEAGLKIIKVKISEILNMWIGNSERNISNLFDTARANKPCIIFLDEIEGLGGRRDGSAGGSKWLNIIVNQLLMEMSDIDHKSEPILVIGATNMPWLMDDALKRSGRFGRVVYIPAPDVDARKELFKLYLKELPVDKSINADKLAQVTENFAASDIMSICEAASTNAFEKSMGSGKEEKITQTMLMDAVKAERSDITEWFNTVAWSLSEEELNEFYPELLSDLKKLKGLRSASKKDKAMYG